MVQKEAVKRCSNESQKARQREIENKKSFVIFFSKRHRTFKIQSF